MSNTPTESNPIDESAPVVAGPGMGYRVKFWIFAFVLIGMGGWFGYDGFINWPDQNAQIERLKVEQQEALNLANSTRANAMREKIAQINKGLEHTDTDILLQKILFSVLPVLGVFLGFRAMRNSRGEYRLEGGVLQVPGHPPVPLENITELDRSLWDRKGIAYVTYDLGDGRHGTLRLDDYFHDRPPTDRIFERVEKFVGGVAEKERTEN